VTKEEKDKIIKKIDAELKQTIIRRIKMRRMRYNYIPIDEEDIYQDIIIKLYNSLDKYVKIDKIPIECWIWKIINVCISKSIQKDVRIKIIDEYKDNYYNEADNYEDIKLNINLSVFDELDKYILELLYNPPELLLITCRNLNGEWKDYIDINSLCLYTNLNKETVLKSIVNIRTGVKKVDLFNSKY
jgi:hypothetical protein